MATPEGAGGTSVLPIGASAAELAALYSTATGGFRPAPVAAQVAARKKTGSKRALAGSSTTAAGGGAAGLAAFLTAVQWRAARDGLLLRAHGAEAAGGPAAAAMASDAGADAEDEGMLSLPGWGVGDAVEGSSVDEEGGGTGRTDGEAGEGHDASAGLQALLRHFRLARSFQRNAELRREAALGRVRLARFRQHLDEQQRAQQEAQRAQQEAQHAQQELETRRGAREGDAARDQARAAKGTGPDSKATGRGSAGGSGSRSQRQEQQVGKKERASVAQTGAGKKVEAAHAAVRAAQPRQGRG